MSLARVFSVGLQGLDGYLVEVEAHSSAGLPGLTLIGLPDAALSEARDRIRAAVLNTGTRWPNRRITVGLSPASQRKHGSGFDLALALVVLAVDDQLPAGGLAGLAVLGELGLDGRLRAVAGALPCALAAVSAGLSRLVVPAENAAEARLVPDLDVVAAHSLAQVVGWLRGGPVPRGRIEGCGGRPGVGRSEPHRRGAEVDLSEVAGQVAGRRALEIAAAGAHHLLLHGPPGGGKTMLAERLPGLLPPLDREAALEVTAVHSVAGLLPAGFGLLTRPPYAAPHHTASMAALVGGGIGAGRPGAVSLAHRGVLFLDEAAEFAPGVLDALRQPLDSGEILVSRAGGAVRYPARFLLVLAANPCPCSGGGAGWQCSCTPSVRRRYRARLSGPLLDRIDLSVSVTAETARLLDRAKAEPSAVVAARVTEARQRTARRLAGTPWRANAEVPGWWLRAELDEQPPAVRRTLDQAVRGGLLSARGLDRVLRVAWTVADLAGLRRPGGPELAEALALRVEMGTG